MKLIFAAEAWDDYLYWHEQDKRMVERGILERDAAGKYRIKPLRKPGHGERWVSPELAKILNENGGAVEGADDPAAADEHYEQL